MDYRELIPASVRAFSSVILGQRAPITESFFTPSELDVLRQTVARAESAGRTSFDYPDYGARDRNLGANINNPMNIGNALLDRAGSMANVLGAARFERAPDGAITIHDRYDFHATPDQLEPYRGLGGFGRLLWGALPHGPMGVLNAIGNYVAPQGEGRPVNIRLEPR